VHGKIPTAEEKLRDGRQEILEELVDLAESSEGSPSDRRRRALELVKELGNYDSLLAHTRPQVIIGEYSKITDASVAVAAFLTDLGHPATMREIIDGVFAGGFRNGAKDDFSFSVRNAVNNRLTGTGKEHPELALTSTAPLKIDPDARISLRMAGWIKATEVVSPEWDAVKRVLHSKR